eukprot:1234859-Prymnesium_polylepis.1
MAGMPRVLSAVSRRTSTFGLILVDIRQFTTATSSRGHTRYGDTDGCHTQRISLSLRAASRVGGRGTGSLRNA